MKVINGHVLTMNTVLNILCDKHIVQVISVIGKLIAYWLPRAQEESHECELVNVILSPNYQTGGRGSASKKQDHSLPPLSPNKVDYYYNVPVLLLFYERKEQKMPKNKDNKFLSLPIEYLMLM